jgi:hypothetical protein
MVKLHRRGRKGHSAIRTRLVTLEIEVPSPDLLVALFLLRKPDWPPPSVVFAVVILPAGLTPRLEPATPPMEVAEELGLTAAAANLHYARL